MYNQWFMKQVGAEWKEMSDDDKEPYIEMNATDKERYAEEMANYTPPPKEDSESSDDE